MRIHRLLPERGGNAGEPYQHQLLHHEIASLYGRNIVTVQGDSVQGFRFAISEQIKRQIFYVNLAQDTENHIKLTAIIKALQRLWDWKRKRSG